MHLALPDSVVDMLCLRDLMSFPPEEREGVINRLGTTMSTRWNRMHEGIGAGAENCHDFLYDVSNDIHEFR